MEKDFKEIQTLKKIGEQSMSVQFKAGPGRQADYCPEEIQRAYEESREREKAEARQ